MTIFFDVVFYHHFVHRIDISCQSLTSSDGQLCKTLHWRRQQPCHLHNEKTGSTSCPLTYARFNYPLTYVRHSFNWHPLTYARHNRPLTYVRSYQWHPLSSARCLLWLQLRLYKITSLPLWLRGDVSMNCIKLGLEHYTLSRSLRLHN